VAGTGVLNNPSAKWRNEGKGFMDLFFKDEVYYDDLYDLWTVEECLRTTEIHNKLTQEKLNKEKDDGLSKEVISQGCLLILKLHLNTIKGERYRNKFSTVQGWIKRDRNYDEKLDRVVCPENVLCLKCSNRMKVISKESYGVEDPFRVLFIFECLGCNKRRGVFDNGEVFMVKPEYCLKCQKEITVEHTRKGNVVTWARTCSYCGFAENEIEDIRLNARKRSW
jgi:hypothetical protein